LVATGNRDYEGLVKLIKSQESLVQKLDSELKKSTRVDSIGMTLRELERLYMQASTQMKALGLSKYDEACYLTKQNCRTLYASFTLLKLIEREAPRFFES